MTDRDPLKEYKPALLTAPDPSGHHVDLLRLLVDRVRDYAIFALDPNGIILTWNAGAKRLKGYEAEEIVGRHFSTFYTKEDLAARVPWTQLDVAVMTGSVEMDGWRLRQDGTRFWANVLITAVRDDSGELVGFAKVTRDMTDRMEAAERIRLSEERFRLLMESVKDYAIFMLNPTGHVATWNAGAQRIKGYDTHEIVGQHFSKFYQQVDIDAGKPARELAIAIQEGRYEEEGWRLRKDGTPFWANVVITPMLQADGELVGYSKVTRDLTERRASDERALEDARRLAAEEAAAQAAHQRASELHDLAEQLRRQTIELEARTLEAEEANRAKVEFLAAMSHELRTPLNAIGGYAQLIEMGISGPISTQQRDHLQRIQRSQRHLLGIINDILNFSRLEAGHLEYDLTTVSVREIVANVSPIVELQAGEAGIRLHVRECPDHLSVYADQPKVEQILINLLVNAIKFTPADGEIELSCGAQADEVWIRVRDTGVGIPPELQESVFAPFVQVGRNLSNPKDGAGLGLAISRDLARGMNGDLTLQSTVGTGSTFTLILPARATIVPVSEP